MAGRPQPYSAQERLSRARFGYVTLLSWCHIPLRIRPPNPYNTKRQGPCPVPLPLCHAPDLWSSTKRLCEALGECRGAKPLCRGSRGVPLIFCDFPRAGGWEQPRPCYGHHTDVPHTGTRLHLDKASALPWPDGQSSSGRQPRIWKEPPKKHFLQTIKQSRLARSLAAG